MTARVTAGASSASPLATILTAAAICLVEGVLTGVAAGRQQVGERGEGQAGHEHAGHRASQFDPRTCLNVISQSGTYQITGGTGRNAGIGGHGTYQLSLEFVAARSHGQCTSGRAPAAEQELLRLSGPVRL